VRADGKIPVWIYVAIASEAASKIAIGAKLTLVKLISMSRCGNE
jgi:hypothetical protein